MSDNSDNKEIVIPGWARSKRTQLAIALAVLFFLGIGVGKSGAGPAAPFADLQRPQATVTATVPGPVSTVTMNAAPASTVTVAGPVRTVTVSTTVRVQPVATTTVSVTPRHTTVVKAPVAAAPRVTPKASSVAKPVPLVGSSVYYKNCSVARAAGVTPLHRGDPGYAKHLDRDGDGVACE